MSPQQSGKLPAVSVIEAVRHFVLGQINRHQNNRLVYHNYGFIQTLVAKTAEISEAVGLSPDRAEIPQLAAWFLNLGYLFDYEKQAERSLDIAARFLEAQKYPEQNRQLVLACLQVVLLEKKPASPEEEIFSDAHAVLTCIEDFAERNPLEKLEGELMAGRKSSKLEWAQLQFQRLLSIRLYTSFVRTQYENQLGLNILRQKEVVEKLLRRKESAPEEVLSPALDPYENLEDGVPQRALQTFFRTNYRNHINLSAIADNKANIMISVNSILISVLITILTYRNITDTNPSVILPAVIFLMSALVSLIFAVLSARPKVTMLNQKEMPIETIKKNIIFFGNYVNLNLDQYEEALDEVFRDSSLLYGNMTRDLYFLGQVLAKKYYYLTISYNIFMAGFIATVGTFLLAFFL